MKIQRITYEEGLKMASIEIVQPGLSLNYVPDEEELKRCYEYGVNLAAFVRERS